ncbi:hypothetical protein [Geobacter sp. FeAm09]|uniref:hypothetical protein n=1 Tax=Geobacter sp. FeAm09 TaxID=2597769 RepID=UPI00143E0EAF|nr:hypothetical protein [Geobacter sp. FeAm09]
MTAITTKDGMVSNEFLRQLIQADERRASREERRRLEAMAPKSMIDVLVDFLRRLFF